MDMSWHFQHLRETLGIPHIINTVGFMLAIGLTLYQTRNRLFADTRTRNLVWGGLIFFLVGIPVDDWYHRTYGIDLTAWSPAHATLYIGTFLMLLGSFTDHLKAGKPNLWISLLYCFYLLEDTVFALGQQEYGAVQLYLIQQGRAVIDADLLALVKDPFYQTYGGFPLALYPVALVGGYLFAMGMARKFTGFRWAATSAVGLYIAFRLAGWLIFRSVGMPYSFIPFFAIGMGLIVDLSGERLKGWRGHVAGALAATGFAYGAAYLIGQWMLMPIWPQSSIWMGALAGLTGLPLGGWVAGYVLNRSDQPEPTRAPRVA